MFYTKNLPTWERALRVVAGVAIAVVGLVSHQPPLIAGTLLATGIFTGMTGFFGFCPMCALVGRKLDKR
jgi:hypothetical protein